MHGQVPWRPSPNPRGASCVPFHAHRPTRGPAAVADTHHCCCGPREHRRLPASCDVAPSPSCAVAREAGVGALASPVEAALLRSKCATAPRRASCSCCTPASGTRIADCFERFNSVCRGLASVYEQSGPSDRSQVCGIESSILGTSITELFKASNRALRYHNRADAAAGRDGVSRRFYCRSRRVLKGAAERSVLQE
jgi:hypothetical protein